MISRSDQLTSGSAPESSAPSTVVTIGYVVLIGGVLALMYAPLLFWLGYAGIKIDQLTTSGVLVLLALFLSIRNTLRHAPFAPAIRGEGLLLLVAGFGMLALAPYMKLARFPLVLISFCVSFAAIVSFLFGRRGIRYFLPALAAIMVFGLMAVLFPGLDWPLRAMAGRYAAGFLTWLGFPVELAVNTQGAPELMLIVPERVFIVATECNGFGLLVSSIMLATILVFHFRLPLLNAFGLVVLAAPIAIGCNMLRIVSISLLAPRLPINYLLLHEVLGLVFYYAGLIAIWVAAERRAQPDPNAAQPKSEPLTAIGKETP